MAAEPGARFTDAVSLACHDLRTPLATIAGFAKTMIRGGQLPEREGHFVGMIDEAASQIAVLVDLIGFATRIESGRFEPTLTDADTLDLAESAGDERVSAGGVGATIETDVEVVRGSLAALALAALRHGQVDAVTWAVDGRDLTLAPVLPAAAPVVMGSSPRDLGALVAGMAIVSLGGAIALDAETARVRL